MINVILPKSLELAARSCGEPKWIGEIVMALVTDGPVARLDIGQKTVIAMCLKEIEDRDLKRAAWAAMKRKSRAGGSR